MKNGKFLIIVVVFTVIIAGICIETYSPEKRKKSKEYQIYEKQQKLKLINNYLNSQVKNSSMNRSITFRGGTTSNFEGPQVHIEYLKFHDKHYNSEGEQMAFFDGNTLNFDPDHPYFGLPNIIAKVSPVSVFEPETGGLSSLLRLSSNEVSLEPYKIYHKTIIPNNDSLVLRDFEMQLWLTEFKLTVDVEPARKEPSVSPSREDKDKIKYPGKWYGGGENYIKLGDLKQEWKNYRYSDLTFILKIIPNNAPWYYISEDGQNARPGIGIGAVYCKSIDPTTEPDEQRISPNIQKGSVLFLHPYYQPGEASPPVISTSENIDIAAKQLLNKQETIIDTTDSFWNKPFFIRIFFNNIGSWKEGLFGSRKFDDQVTFSFVMPIFVIGSWDIIPPSEIIPKWDPPKPYYKDFLKNIIPSFGFGSFGKILAGVGWIVTIVFVLALFVPAISAFLKKIIHL